MKTSMAPRFPNTWVMIMKKNAPILWKVNIDLCAKNYYYEHTMYYNYIRINILATQCCTYHRIFTPKVVCDKPFKESAGLLKIFGVIPIFQSKWTVVKLKINASNKNSKNDHDSNLDWKSKYCIHCTRIVTTSVRIHSKPERKTGHAYFS